MNRLLFLLLFLLFFSGATHANAQHAAGEGLVFEKPGLVGNPVRSWAEVDAYFRSAAPLRSTSLPRRRELIPEKQYPFVAAAEVVAVNALVWGYNRFIAGADWAKISGETMKTNLREGWEWDDNQFSNNQIAHPFHGNLYYNAARSNGFGYWGSIPFTFAGSWMWEYLGETHHPAPNDWLTTSFGGMALGEVLHRFSNLVIDNTQTGWQRTWREGVAAALNPVQFFNRLGRGDLTRVKDESANLRPSTLLTRFDFGGMGHFDDEGRETYTAQAFANLSVWYGDLWHDEIERPYDAFDFSIQANTVDEKLINLARGKGALLQWDLGQSDRHNVGLNLMQYYDYLHNLYFDYGAMSFGLGLYPRWAVSDLSEIRGSLHLTGIVIGATSSEYADLAGRTYDYGPGVGSVVELYYSRKGWDWLRYQYFFSWLNTANGSRSNHFIHGALVSLVIPVFRNVGVGVEYGLYRRFTYFKNFPDTDRRNVQFRGVISMELNGRPDALTRDPAREKVPPPGKKNRKGFIVGAGLGGGYTWTSEEATSDTSATDAGLSTVLDLKVGHAFSNQLMFYWHGIKNLTALGGTYFFQPYAPSFYVEGSLGLASRDTASGESTEARQSGAGFFAGGGYEFARHWMIDVGLMIQGFESEGSIDTQTALKLSLNYLLY